MSIVKKIIYVVALFVCICLVYSLYSTYLDNQISALYAKKTGSVALQNGAPEKDKGNICIKESADRGELFLVGSSELSSPVPQNPKTYFPNNYYNKGISCIGHAHTQNLLDAINFGANTASFRGSDVAVVESIQWFIGDDVDSTGFMANFSELQFYQFLQNPNISKKNKDYLCDRFLEIEAARAKASAEEEKNNGSSGGKTDPEIPNELKKLESKGMFRASVDKPDYPQTHVLAGLFRSKSAAGKVGYYALKPYYYFRGKYLELKDRYDTVAYLKTLADKKAQTRTIDWDKEYSTAETEGKAACTNNSFVVNDEYYSTYLAPRIYTLKDSLSAMELMTSKEWEDYEFMLSVCNELKLKPYIVIMSVNGKYYDYCGMTKDKRDAYYSRSEKMAEEHGITTLDLKGKEYEPYFYTDVMHLGWKGWLYVEQNIIKNFSK